MIANHKRVIPLHNLQVILIRHKMYTSLQQTAVSDYFYPTLDLMSWFMYDLPTISTENKTQSLMKAILEAVLQLVVFLVHFKLF